MEAIGRQSPFLASPLENRNFTFKKWAADLKISECKNLNEVNQIRTELQDLARGLAVR